MHLFRLYIYNMNRHEMEIKGICIGSSAVFACSAMHIYVHIQMYVYIYLFIHIHRDRVYVFVYIYMYIYIYLFIYTVFIHIHLPRTACAADKHGQKMEWDSKR